MRPFLSIVLGLIASSSCIAQDAIADSAEMARVAWSSAVRALRDGDITAARAHVERAATAWPTQPYYRWRQVVIAARAGDTSTVRRELFAYLRMGLVADLSDSALVPFRARTWFAEVEAVNAANSAPLAASVTHAQLRSESLWPEGLDIDPATGTVYVTSVRHRTIVAVARDGRERWLWPADSGPGAVLAVRRDLAGDALWVTVAGIPQMARFAPGDTAVAALLKVRIGDGAVLRRLDLPAGRHIPGDLAILRSGDILISDSFAPVLYRLRPGSDTLEAIRSPLFRSLQGIAIDPSGRAFVADYSHGLLRVDLQTSRVTRIADAPNSTSLGCDGIGWHAGAIIAIQNGVRPARVMRYDLNAAGDSIVAATVIDRNIRIADEPTLGVITGDDFFYVANSQWEKHTDAGTVRPDAPLTAPIILRLRLRR